MAKQMRYLTTDDIARIHSFIIDEIGGAHGVRDQHALHAVEDYKPQMVIDFRIKNFAELQQPGNHLGIWLDKGRMYLDVSQVGEASQVTLDKAADAQQLAVFDLENFKSIKTSYGEKIDSDNLNGGQVGGADGQGGAGSSGQVSEVGTGKQNKYETEQAHSTGSGRANQHRNHRFRQFQMTYAYQILGKGDVELLKRLLKVFGEAFSDIETYQGAVPSDQYLQSLLSDPHFIVVVALSEGEVVGGLAAYELKKFEQERSEIYIYDLAVAESHRRKGVATELIKQLKTVGRDRGAYVIYVQADSPDAPAIALYNSLGTKEAVYHFDIPVDE